MWCWGGMGGAGGDKYKSILPVWHVGSYGWCRWSLHHHRPILMSLRRGRLKRWGGEGGGGCLNISAIIASQPWHAVCQPPQGSLHSSQENVYTKSSTQKYTGPAQRNTQDWQTECKRSVSSLHSCTWPHTLSHLSFPRHCHHRAAHHPWHDRHQKPTLG